MSLFDPEPTATLSKNLAGYQILLNAAAEELFEAHNVGDIARVELWFDREGEAIWMVPCEQGGWALTHNGSHDDIEVGRRIYATGFCLAWGLRWEQTKRYPVYMDGETLIIDLSVAGQDKISQGGRYPEGTSRAKAAQSRHPAAAARAVAARAARKWREWGGESAPPSKFA